MTEQPDAPADTRMMGIVHRALRRDLARSTTVLSGASMLSDDQRGALNAHLGWMMRFLRDHHEGEDKGLYPMVRDRDAGAAPLLDRMSADHDTVASSIVAVESATDGFARRGGEEERARLFAAVEHLEEDLLPHLRDEEDELMPVVSATITNAEWRAWDKAFNLDPKSFVELGREGHWILDGLGPADRKLVVELVPPVPRFVLLHGFAGSYRRHLAACWGSPTPHPRRIARSCHVEVVVDAPPDAVWDVVCDVTKVGEWSNECVEAEWLDGATIAQPGARFRGRNRAGAFRWGRQCEVLSATPHTLVWRTVPTLLFPDSTEWTIRLHDDPAGTRIEQSFTILKLPRLLDWVFATSIPAHRDRTEALTQDLRQLGVRSLRVGSS